MITNLNLFAQAKTISVPSWVIILLLPCAYLVSVFLLRDHAGPFWIWSNLDPDYFYLLDSLNIINLNWPVSIYHPGTPLQVLGAVLIKAMHPLATSDQITQFALQNPEKYLHAIFISLVLINSLALAFLGLCGYLAFKDRLAVILLQIGPFISTLSIKWMTHVAPEPLLITVVLVLAGVALLALRSGQLEINKNTYAILFGLIAGFGMATKITSVGLYFLPIFLLWSPRALFIYASASLMSMILFTLPAAGSIGEFVGHINNISVGSTQLGEVKKPFIDVLQYPKEFIRVSSRPAFFMVFLLSLGMVVYLGFKARYQARPFPLAGRLLAGLCLADLVQALVVAKHPSGHYMIPVLVLSTLGITLFYRLLLDLNTTSHTAVVRIRGGFAALCAALLIAQTATVIKLDTQFRERARVATGLNDDRFQHCARIYFWSAASPSYALQLGSDMVGNPFATHLKQTRPANDYWYEIVDQDFRDWMGPVDLQDIAAAHPCLYARGLYEKHIMPALTDHLPTHTFSTACSPAGEHETIITSGVDCQGTIQ